MRIQHRISEDLDFVYNQRLPRPVMAGLMQSLKESGFQVDRDDDQNVYWEFIVAGDHVYEWQQNFIVNGVKLNIFSAHDNLKRIIAFNTPGEARVAELKELFLSKVLAASGRCVSRDWIDLYLLCKDHGFVLSDFEEAFKLTQPGSVTRYVERAFDNLTRGRMPPQDAGYATMMRNPPSLEDVAEYFSNLRDEYEVLTAFRLKTNSQ